MKKMCIRDRHNAIAEGLKNRDKEAATLAMHKHVKNQAVAVKSVIQCQDEKMCIRDRIQASHNAAQHNVCQTVISRKCRQL